MLIAVGVCFFQELLCSKLHWFGVVLKLLHVSIVRVLAAQHSVGIHWKLAGFGALADEIEEELEVGEEHALYGTHAFAPRRRATHAVPITAMTVHGATQQPSGGGGRVADCHRTS